jgi:hypothetical protein
MFDLSFLNLTPLIWRQEIRHYSKLSIGDDEGGFLTATCTPDASCELLLSNGAKLRDQEISLGIARGDLGADKRQQGSLTNDAIGGLYFIEEQNFVHGWLYFKSNNYSALWDQVRNGGYVGCVIGLGVQPVQGKVWKSNKLSIISASVSFDRKPAADMHADQKKSRSGFFARSRQ